MQSWLEHNRSFHFNSPPSNLELNNCEIHVWKASLDQPEYVLQMFTKRLSVDERKRSEQFQYDRDKGRFKAGRGILRTILGHYLDMDPVQLQFYYGINGKPALSDTFGEETIHFNMSASEDVALYIFARDREVGVDIEHICDIPEMDMIVEKYFSSKEHDYYRFLPERKKKEWFFLCWTRKESLLKAIGCGLSHPFAKNEVSLNISEQKSIFKIEGDSNKQTRWFIQNIEIVKGFKSAIAIQGHGINLQCWQFEKKKRDINVLPSN